MLFYRNGTENILFDFKFPTVSRKQLSVNIFINCSGDNIFSHNEEKKIFFLDVKGFNCFNITKT